MRKHVTRRILILLMSVFVLTMMTPLVSFGTEIQEKQPRVQYMIPGPSFSYKDITEYKKVESPDITEIGTKAADPNLWYVVDSLVEITDHRLNVKGEANILLMDNGKLVCGRGIGVTAVDNAVLSIYSQAAMQGQLTAYGYDPSIVIDSKGSGAAIGGNLDDPTCGTVNIYGGIIQALGRNGKHAAIGGAYGGNGGTINIAYGDIEAATGSSSYFRGAAAIGGGAAEGNKGGGCGNITISGAYSLKAYGHDDNPGIGNGEECSQTDGNTVNITGGNIEAGGGTNGAGIGGGYDGTVPDIFISGNPEIRAYGNYSQSKENAKSGAGIGSGKNGYGGSINISGGKIHAEGGRNAAGIGGGENCGAGQINISGGNVEAWGGKYGAGIGNGESAKKTGKITIAGGIINATGGADSAGIGGGDNSSAGIIEITGGYIHTTPGVNDDIVNYHGVGTRGAGIGGGDEGDGGHITIRGGDITVQGSEYAAGIGGGEHGDCGDLKIFGGTINATGGKNGAGIGSGDGAKQNGTIEIHGGTITAKGGDNGAGIGGGDKSPGAVVTINDGDVTAIGAGYGAGIGGGNGASTVLTVINGGRVIAQAGEKCQCRTEKGGSAIGAGDGLKDKDSPASGGYLQISDLYKVTGGDSASTLEATATRDNRQPYCRWRNYVVIEPCDHKDAVIKPSTDPNVSEMVCEHCYIDLIDPETGKPVAGQGGQDINNIVSGIDVNEPSISTDDGTELVEGRDYIVSYWPKKPGGIGNYKLLLIGIGEYSGTDTVDFKIVPQGTSVSNVKAAKKAVTVKWKKGLKKSSVSGYQVQLATDKKFKKNKKTLNVKGFSKTSVKIGKLKAKKRYYVRVRVYKTIDGERFYSSWSKAKNVKTR